MADIPDKHSGKHSILQRLGRFCMLVYSVTTCSLTDFRDDVTPQTEVHDSYFESSDFTGECNNAINSFEL